MASNTAQPTVGLLLLAALIVAALGTRPAADKPADLIQNADGSDADRPDARTLRDLAGLSVGLQTLRQLGAMLEAAPPAIEAANHSAEQGIAVLETATDAWMRASAFAIASLPRAETPGAGLAAIEEAPADPAEIAARLGLLRPEAVAAWSDAVADALGRTRESAVESLVRIYASLDDRAASLGERLAGLWHLGDRVSSSLQLFVSAGAAEPPSPAATPRVLLSPEPVMPSSPTGHGGWWSPMGSDLPGFESGWYDQLTDSMLPHDYDIPHAR